MPNNGWMGDAQHLLHALDVAGADKDEEGNFLIEGRVASFMGAGEELVVPDNARYFVDGKPANLAGLMNSTSYGLRNVTVIE